MKLVRCLIFRLGTLPYSARVIRLVVTLLVGGVGYPADLSLADLYWRTDGVSASWNSTNWGPYGGPYASGWSSGATAEFTANSAVSYVTNTIVGNVTVEPGIAVTVAANGTLNTGGMVRTVSVGANSTLTWAGQGFSAAIGTGFTKEGAGTWDMGTQANAYPGGFTLNAGTVITTGTKVFGNSPITINGGTLQSTFSTAGSFSGLGMTIGGDFTLAGAGQNATFPMNVSLGGSTRTITNSTTAGGRIFSGVVSGGAGAGLTFAGTGVTTLGGANTYTGDTAVNSGGTLALGAGGSIAGSPNIVVGSGATFDVSAVSGYTVGSGQTLKGSGAVKGAVAVNGSVSPGDSSIGVLSFGSSLTLNSASTLKAEINSSAGTADLLNVVGDLSLLSGATLNLSDLGSSLLAVGTKLKLIGYGGNLTGTFSGKLNDSLLTIGANRFVINYDDTIGGSKYVTLTSAVPEARSFWYGALLASVAGLGFVTRTAMRRSHGELRN